MKVYFAVLRIPPELKNSINAFNSAENFQKWKFKDEMWESIFAYTIKKKYMKKFKKLHGTKYFKYIYEEFDNEIHFSEMLGQSLESHEIKCIKIKNKGKRVKLYITEEEENVSLDQSSIVSLILDMLYPTKGHSIPMPKIFDRDILVYLEKLGYSSIFFEHGLVFPDDDSDYESDIISDYQIFCDNSSWADCSNGSFSTSEGVITNRPKLKLLDSFLFNYEKILEGE